MGLNVSPGSNTSLIHASDTIPREPASIPISCLCRLSASSLGRSSCEAVPTAVPPPFAFVDARAHLRPRSVQSASTYSVLKSLVVTFRPGASTIFFTVNALPKVVQTFVPSIVGQSFSRSLAEYVAQDESFSFAHLVSSFVDRRFHRVCHLDAIYSVFASVVIANGLVELQVTQLRNRCGRAQS